MKLSFAFFVVAISMHASTARAEFVINIGDHELMADTGHQEIDLFLTSDDLADPSINGMNLRVVLGDGSGDQGIFQGSPGGVEGVRFGGIGSFWEGTVNGFSIGGSIPLGPGDEAFGEVSINFNNDDAVQVTQPVGIAAPRRIATLIIDTTGLLDGTFAIDASDSMGTGIGATNLILAGGVEQSIRINNGTFRVTATVVPEPGAILFLAAIAMWVAARRRSSERLHEEAAEANLPRKNGHLSA